MAGEPVNAACIFGWMNASYTFTGATETDTFCVIFPNLITPVFVVHAYRRLKRPSNMRLSAEPKPVTGVVSPVPIGKRHGFKV